MSEKHEEQVEKNGRGKDFSRRAFLRNTGLAVGAAAIGGTLVVDGHWDIGGHAATIGGNLHSGAGTKIQQKYGIEDSPDQYFLDHTTNLTQESRFNDHEITRAIADSMAEAFEFILDNGVRIYDREPTKGNSYLVGGTSPQRVARDTLVEVETEQWVGYNSSLTPIEGDVKRGMGLVRPLEHTARQEGGTALCGYRRRPPRGRHPACTTH